eukprot:Gb_38442 [translate_table: standard]
MFMFVSLFRFKGENGTIFFWIRCQMIVPQLTLSSSRLFTLFWGHIRTIEEEAAQCNGGRNDRILTTCCCIRQPHWSGGFYQPDSC